MYTLHKAWSTCLACMYTLVTVFLAAVPEHRCDIQELTSTDLNCTEEQIVSVFIPNEQRHGEILPSQCQYYNLSSLSDNLTEISISSQQCTLGNLSGYVSPVDCDKWTYDKSFYKSTIIDEVNFTFLLILYQDKCWILRNNNGPKETEVDRKWTVLCHCQNFFVCSGTLCVHDLVWLLTPTLCIGLALWLDC